tara:strand:- start:56 stop:223 length:168 start_codon:yes stop_codon:yes gene_type:complete
MSSLGISCHLTIFLNKYSSLVSLKNFAGSTTNKPILDMGLRAGFPSAAFFVQSSH